MSEPSTADLPTVTEADIARGTAGLTALRQARRSNHRSKVHWVDALYKAYMTGLIAGAAIWFGASYFPDAKIDAATQQQLLEQGPRWLGLLGAVAVFIGLRTGSRGGPLAIEAPAIQYELMAPVPRAAVLRGPALQNLRFSAFAGSMVGGVVGVVASRRVDVGPIVAAVACAASFAALAVLANAVALVACGRRLGKVVAVLLGFAVISWSVADVVAGVSTSPLTGLGAITFLPLGFTPIVVAGVVAVPLAVVAALAGLEHISIERALQRAGLVAQLRFAATMQDVRTVVLLRRQLSQERARATPWIRLGRGRTTGRRSSIPTWRRDWQCYFRFPATRLLRMVLLGVAAGVAIGFTWRGAYPAFVLAGLALFLAAYDAVEPIAQEVDHPTRWDALAGDEGRILLSHLYAAFVLMVVPTGVATLTAWCFVPTTVVAQAVAPLFLSVTASAVAGAALSTTMGSVGAGSSLSGVTGADAMGMDVMGTFTVLRMAIPPGLVVGALAPMMALGVDPDHLNTQRMSNLTTWPIMAWILAFLYVRYRKPSRV